MARGYIVRPGHPGFVEYGGRPLGQLGGAPGLFIGSGGTFTRTSEAFFYTGPPALGGYGGWASSGQRRISYFPGLLSGYGLWMEGSRTNVVAQPQNITGAAWTSNGVDTTNVAVGPDGSTTADRSQTTSGQRGTRIQNVILSANGGPYAFSCYAKRVAAAGSGVFQMWIDSSGTGDAGLNSTISDSVWARQIVIATPASTNQVWYQPYCGAAAGVGGVTAQALDYLTDLHQVEIGAFASSPIRTAATRQPDQLSFAAGEYPASFLTTGFRVYFAPAMSSAQHVAAGLVQRLVSVNATNVLRLQAGAANAQAFFNGSGASGGITWSGDQIITFDVRPTAGTLTVAGATTGNGTFTAGAPAAWPSGTLTIGGGGEAFGTFGLIIEALR